MKSMADFPKWEKKHITHVLTDIDDTLTTEGQLPACAYKAMEDLKKKGIKVIPVTGRPAGWCDHIARMWPVNGVVGENGAFYFVYDESKKKMIRRYIKAKTERNQDRIKLAQLEQEILKAVPGCIVSADQAYREADLAIDFCEDVPALGQAQIKRIVEIFKSRGATAKVSSIHVNGWFGTYDKLTMTKIIFKEIFDLDLDTIKDQVVFSGDSPNDEPMFAYFPHSVGVANLLGFKNQLKFKPTWITEEKGGQGFASMADILMS